MAETRKMYPFKCASCGVTGEVPFKPENSVLCRDCMQAEREIRRRKAPRRRHGTRVSIPITCVECGKEEILDYMPKGKKLDELMCSDCMSESLGKASRWSAVMKDKSSSESRSWRVDCRGCGVDVFINSRPWPDRDYFCVSCENEFEPGNKDALEKAEKVGAGVHKR